MVKGIKKLILPFSLLMFVLSTSIGKFSFTPLFEGPFQPLPSAASQLLTPPLHSYCNHHKTTFEFFRMAYTEIKNAGCTKCCHPSATYSSLCSISNTSLSVLYRKLLI